MENEIADAGILNLSYGDDITYPLYPERDHEAAINFVLGSYRDDPSSIRISVVDVDEFISLGEVTVNLGSAIRDSEPMPMWTAYLADPDGLPGLVDRMQAVGLAHLEMKDGKPTGHYDQDGNWIQRYVLDRQQFADYDRVGKEDYERSWDMAVALAAPRPRDAEGRPRSIRELTPAEREEVMRLAARKMDEASTTPVEAAEARYERMIKLRQMAGDWRAAAAPSSDVTLAVTSEMAGGPTAKLARIGTAQALRQGITEEELFKRVAASGDAVSMDYGDGRTVNEWASDLLEQRGVPALAIEVPEGTKLPSGRDISGMVATIAYFGNSKPGQFEQPGGTPGDTGYQTLSLPRNGVIELVRYDETVERVERTRTSRLIDGAGELAHGVWNERSVEHKRKVATETLTTTAEHLFGAISENPEHVRSLERTSQRMASQVTKVQRSKAQDTPARELSALRQAASGARRVPGEAQRRNQR